MKADKVIEAAKLLDQHRAIMKFLEDSPDPAELMTITFRNGKYSKSLSIRNENIQRDVRSYVEDIALEIEEAIIKLGVDYDG